MKRARGRRAAELNGRLKIVRRVGKCMCRQDVVSVAVMDLVIRDILRRLEVEVVEGRNRGCKFRRCGWDGRNARRRAVSRTAKISEALTSRVTSTIITAASARIGCRGLPSENERTQALCLIRRTERQTEDLFGRSQHFLRGGGSRLLLITLTA